jgi:SPP1 gp7 family putative phage head morphogenesis protein
MINPTFRAEVPPPQRGRINPLSVSKPEIVEFIERKVPRAVESWQELGAQEHARAFTAARTTGHDVIRDLYEGLLATMQDGGGESDFVDRMLPVLRDKGWLPQLDDQALGRRVALIYDTNLRTSQAVGKWRTFQRTKQLLPYLYYNAVQDRRTRPSHAALHGLLLPVDHPVWLEVFAPCGFGCRCIMNALSRSQAARKGGVTDDATAWAALANAKALSRGEGDFWGRNVGIAADAAAVAHVREVNERRLTGSTPISGTMVLGASIWMGIFDGVIRALLQRLEAQD